MEHILNMENILFGYDKTEILLENINLKIEKGDYIGIIGPNGSAKSTLLKLILGILTPIKGSIKLFDKDINNFNEWNKLGYISQKANSFNSDFPITVEEVIKMQILSKYSFFKRYSLKNKISNDIDRVLDLVSMKEFKKKLIGNLSGGQQQRIFIARAIVNDPELLIMDEPTVGIDSESQIAFYDILDKLNKKGISIIIITHDVAQICDNASKIACISDKKIHIHDTKNTLTKEHLKEIYGYNVLGTFKK